MNEQLSFLDTTVRPALVNIIASMVGAKAKDQLAFISESLESLGEVPQERSPIIAHRLDPDQVEIVVSPSRRLNELLSSFDLAPEIRNLLNSAELNHPLDTENQLNFLVGLLEGESSRIEISTSSTELGTA
jgi:hypothetical protein